MPQPTVKKRTKPEDTRKRTGLPHGAYRFIAEQLLDPKCSAQQVREVFLGNRTSPRVTKAIRAYERGLEVMKQSA